MRTSFVTVLHQHVQGYNAKAGHVAGLPGMTAVHGFQTALAMKLGQALDTTFVPRGFTMAVSQFQLRDGQPGYIWTAVNNSSAKPDDIVFPSDFPEDKKSQARKQTAFGKNPSTAHEIQGDAILHLVMAFDNEDDVDVSPHAVEEALTTMRLAGGELPTQVPRQWARKVDVSFTYDDALASIPGSAWVLEDATPAFERFLHRYPQLSVIDAFLLFTSNQRRRKAVKSSDSVVDSDASNGSDADHPEKGNAKDELPQDVGLDDQVILGNYTTGVAASDPFDDPEMLLLPHRMPVLSGWRLLTEPDLLSTVQRVPGAPTAMAEAVHGVVFARKAGVIRAERSKARDNRTPAPPTHFCWTWHHLGGAKAGLLVGEECV